MRRTILSTLAIGFLLSMSGCTRYYRVTEPRSDQVFYTKKVEHLGNGAVMLRDDSTGGDVILQNSMIVRIDEEEFVSVAGPVD